MNFDVRTLDGVRVRFGGTCGRVTAALTWALADMAEPPSRIAAVALIRQAFGLPLPSCMLIGTWDAFPGGTHPALDETVIKAILRGPALK